MPKKSPPERVTLTTDPRTWYDSRTHRDQNYLRLLHANGEPLLSGSLEIKRWRRKPRAVRYLENLAQLGSAFVLVDATGMGEEPTELVIQPPGYVHPDEEDRYGPHHWRQKDVVAIHSPGGTFTRWRCVLCGWKMRCHKRDARPDPGACSRNPKPGMDEEDA